MLENLKKRADSFDNWEVEVEKAFEATGADRYGEHSPPLLYQKPRQKFEPFFRTIFSPAIFHLQVCEPLGRRIPLLFV